MTSRVSSLRVAILSMQAAGGFRGGILISGCVSLAGSMMSATLKFLPHCWHMRRPRHLAVRICRSRHEHQLRAGPLSSKCCKYEVTGLNSAARALHAGCSRGRAVVSRLHECAAAPLQALVQVCWLATWMLRSAASHGVSKTSAASHGVSKTTPGCFDGPPHITGPSQGAEQLGFMAGHNLQPPQTQ